MWRHHDKALWHHGRGALQNDSWADIANHVTRLWQAGDTENFERRITGQLCAVSRSRAAKSRDKCFEDDKLIVICKIGSLIIKDQEIQDGRQFWPKIVHDIEQI